MKNIEKLEITTKNKVYKFNRLFNLGSISYEVEIRNNSVRIYNEHGASYVKNQKELAIWIKESKRAFRNFID